METQSIEIDKELIESCHLYKDRWHTLKGFVMDMIKLGIQTKYGGLTTYATMKKTDRNKGKEEEEGKVFYTSKVHNTRINKEKSKIFSLNSTPPPIHLEFCKDLIEKFWEVKKGSRSKEAYQLLIGPKGLGGISKNHGETAVKDQLEEAIANKWQSITLKNYEAFGRPQKADKEPVTGHPAQRVWKDGGFVD